MTNYADGAAGESTEVSSVWTAVKYAIALWEADGSLLTVTEEHDQALELIIKEARLMSIVRSLPIDCIMEHEPDGDWRLLSLHKEATTDFCGRTIDEALLAYQKSTEEK